MKERSPYLYVICDWGVNGGSEKRPALKTVRITYVLPQVKFCNANRSKWTLNCLPHVMNLVFRIAIITLMIATNTTIWNNFLLYGFTLLYLN